MQDFKRVSVNQITDVKKRSTWRRSSPRGRFFRVLARQLRIEVSIVNHLPAASGSAVRDFDNGRWREQLPHIFDPFFTTGRGKGSGGLGIAIVYNIVTAQLGGPPGHSTPTQIVEPNMYKIRLINMPFASALAPSIALTQLRAVTEERLAGRVSIDIAYLTHDFARDLGFDTYMFVSNSMAALYAGLGDWFFRALAFPDLPDNTEAYLRRFFPGQGPDRERVAKLIDQRVGLDTYLDGLIDRYQLDRADVVGFTSMFMQNGAAFAMARRLKQRNPAIVTLIGGANCEFPMGQVIANRVPALDYVFSGAALRSFPDFVERLLNGEQNSAPVNGVLSRSLPSPAAELAHGDELSIDVAIPLDYSGFLSQFESNFPNLTAKPVLPVETSRGCWWGQRAHCTFCGLNGATMAYRAMRPELAIEQFNALFRLSSKADVIEAVDNILPKEYLSQVLPQLETPENMRIFYEVKADLSAHDMKTLARAKVTLIQPGIESLATSTLKLMKKGTSAPQNITFLKNCATFGIRPFWNLLVGFPGETAEVYERYAEVLPRLTHLTPPNGIFPVRFDRFSPYHKLAADYRLDLVPMDFYGFVYPFAADDMREFAYYFSDQDWLADYVQAMAEGLPPLRDLVAQWQERWRAAAGQGTLLELRFNDTGDAVVDSRSGVWVEHPIDPVAAALLREAARPARLDQLRDRLAPLYGAEIETAIAWLDDKGFVFREGDRIVSLLLEADRCEHDTEDASRVPSQSGEATARRVVPLIAAKN